MRLDPYGLLVTKESSHSSCFFVPPIIVFRVSAPTLEPDGLSRRHFAMAQAEQEEARRVVKGIAKLKVNRTEFDGQATSLRNTNVVYKTAIYNADLVAEWCPDANRAQVPPTIVDSVVSVPVGEDGPGRVVASGLGDATASG